MIYDASDMLKVPMVNFAKSMKNQPGRALIYLQIQGVNAVSHGFNQKLESIIEWPLPTWYQSIVYDPCLSNVGMFPKLPYHTGARHFSNELKYIDYFNGFDH